MSDLKAPGAGRLKLNVEAQHWLKLKWVKIRKAQQEADKANNEWNAMNKAFTKWLDEMGIDDPLQRSQRKSANLTLNDSLATGKWHAAEAQRHIDDVNLFLKLKELEIL